MSATNLTALVKTKAETFNWLSTDVVLYWFDWRRLKTVGLNLLRFWRSCSVLNNDSQNCSQGFPGRPFTVSGSECSDFSEKRKNGSLGNRKLSRFIKNMMKNKSGAIQRIYSETCQYRETRIKNVQPVLTPTGPHSPSVWTFWTPQINDDVVFF